MSWISSLTEWFSSSSSFHKAAVQLDHAVDELSTAAGKHVAIALLIGLAATDVAQAQTQSGGERGSFPVIEAVEQEAVEEIYRQARNINEDKSFDPEDGPREIDHAKDLLTEFNHVGKEIEDLIDDGEIEEATMLLKTVSESLDQTHKNLTRLLRSAKQADDDQDLINGLETITEDLTSVRDNIDIQQNRLAKTLGAIENLKEAIKDDPHVTAEEQDGKFIMRITMEDEKLSEARASVVERLEKYLGGTGLQGETYVDTEIPEGDEKIKATSVTTFTYK